MDQSLQETAATAIATVTTTATAAALESMSEYAAGADRHPVVSFLSAFFWVILYLLSWVQWAVAFVTITIPRLIYFILSYSMTLTLNFWSFAIMFVLSGVALNYWIRFRYLNSYANLVEKPLEKPDAQALHPDVNTTDPPPAFHNYLDEFLQAVRVFGFLEKPVFHELARHLQTRRLIAGDSLSLDQDKSFYCVVDGTVQVFAPSGKQKESQSGSWDNEDMNGYELMNEVGSGGTLSSLFTILSLFTEDVKISAAAEPGMDTETDLDNDRLTMPPSAVRTRLNRANSDVSHFDLSLPGQTAARSRSPSVASSSGSTVLAEASSPTPTVMGAGLRSPNATDVDSDGTQTLRSPTVAALRSPSVRSRTSSAPSTPQRRTTPAPSYPQRGQQRKIPSLHPHQIHHGTVARATEDSTLAVIPAEAFRRLTKKFPKATAHIVQVIMTRFSRVTFNAAHQYLGLTTEVLRTEKAINDIACHPLPPSFFEGGGMEQLRQRFDAPAEPSDYFSHVGHTPSTTTSTATSSSTPLSPGGPRKFDRSQSIFKLSQSPEAMKPRTPDAIKRPSPKFLDTMRARSNRHLQQAGDLLSSTNHSNDTYRLPRQFSYMQAPKFRRDISLENEASTALNESEHLTPGEDFDLREEVMSCIAVSIGLLQPPMSGDGSAEASPAVSAVDGHGLRSGMAYPSSFGSLSLLDMADDQSSMTGGSSSLTMNGGYLSGLDNEVEILFFSAGSYLARAGERNTGLFYVIEGFLDILLPVDEKVAPKQESTPPDTKPDLLREELWSASTESVTSGSTKGTSKPSKPTNPQSTERGPKGRHLFTVKPGGIAGYLASLSNIASYVDIQAKTDAYVGFLPHHALERLLEKQPIVLLTLAKRLISLLSPLVLQIDASLDWVQVNAGQVLWRAGDVSDSFYIVINGRLRAITEKEQGKVNIEAEYGQGDTAGEIDVITSTPRRNTVHAIRDTELIRMPQTLFNAISSRNPQTTALLLRMIASRVRDEIDTASIARTRNPATELRRNNAKLKTVAILPSTRNIPIEAFARRLHAALESIGTPTSYLNQASISNTLGRHAFTRMGKLKTAAWLADQEQRYDIVLYVADSVVSNSWTQTCIRQADCVMVLGMGEDPSIGEYERLLLSMKTTARKELILLHPDRSVVPGSTREWLKTRPWIHQHIHVELPGLKVPESRPIPSTPQDPAAVAALKKVKDRVQSELQKYRGTRAGVRPPRPPHSNDFARLARRICGTSVGVVLGGGGARGLSHLGALRALEEYGIPVDHIGGTSIGSFIGGLYAREGDIISSAGRAKQASARLGNIWRMLSDVTYPLVAYTTGHEFNRAIYKSFYDLHIEDMWLPFFCVSTNINASRMELHETGYAWRFIRASMTLVGILPPLCDNGNMLVDGGYLDNLPVSTMFEMGPKVVFAVDVGSIDDNSPRNFGDTVSGWWLLINRWNPFSSARTVPPIAEIQSRLAYVSSVRTLEEAKVARGCLYMQMPVQEFGTLQFSIFEQIQQKGYTSAMEMLAKFEEEGKLPSGYGDGKDAASKRKKKGQSARRNSV